MLDFEWSGLGSCFGLPSPYYVLRQDTPLSKTLFIPSAQLFKEPGKLCILNSIYVVNRFPTCKCKFVFSRVMKGFFEIFFRGLCVGVFT